MLNALNVAGPIPAFTLLAAARRQSSVEHAVCVPRSHRGADGRVHRLDGEAFSEGFKRLALGKVVGTRTWGGEVWLSFDNTLVDGGIVSAAELGVFGPEGKWLIEGHGVDPDVVVDNLPHAAFLGRGAQLDAAIKLLQEEIRAKPVTVPNAPPYPDQSVPTKKP